MCIRDRLIGWEAFDSLLAQEMPNKVYMFLHGIKDGDLNRLRITVDLTGNVTRFDSGAMPTDNIERVIKKTGKWYTNKKLGIISHEHKIFAKERN